MTGEYGDALKVLFLPQKVEHLPEVFVEVFFYLTEADAELCFFCVVKLSQILVKCECSCVLDGESVCKKEVVSEGIALPQFCDSHRSPPVVFTEFFLHFPADSPDRFWSHRGSRSRVQSAWGSGASSPASL